MLVPLINHYKYYLPKVYVTTYRDEPCVFELAFSLVGSSKFPGPISSKIMVSIKIGMKNSLNRGLTGKKVALMRLKGSPRAQLCMRTNMPKGTFVLPA